MILLDTEAIFSFGIEQKSWTVAVFIKLYSQSKTSGLYFKFLQALFQEIYSVLLMYTFSSDLWIHFCFSLLYTIFDMIFHLPWYLTPHVFKDDNPPDYGKSK